MYVTACCGSRPANLCILSACSYAQFVACRQRVGQHVQCAGLTHAVWRLQGSSCQLRLLASTCSCCAADLSYVTVCRHGTLRVEPWWICSTCSKAGLAASGATMCCITTQKCALPGCCLLSSATRNSALQNRSRTLEAVGETLGVTALQVKACYVKLRDSPWL